MKFLRLLIASLLIFALIPALAVESFIVRHIQVQGAQHISAGTVLHYLPIREGQQFTSEKGIEAIRVLYETGFFSNVQLKRKDDTLVVLVQERAIIGQINFFGNKAVSTGKLQTAMKKIGVVIGSPIDAAKLNEIEEGLKQQYEELGYPNVAVNTQLTNLPGNRIAVNIRVTEGKITKVHGIKIEGEKAFTQSKLLKSFKLTTSGLLTFLSHHDRYSEMQLEDDLDNLQNFYYNHGYLQFHVVSKQVTPSPTGKGVDIVVVVSEGAVYRIGGYRAIGMYADDPEVKKIIAKSIHPGQVFARSAIITMNQHIQDYLEDRGYAYAQINIEQNIDEQNHTAFLTFVIEPGHEMYVRRINFSGNYRTQDIMLRGELRQMEGGVYSLKEVNESKRRLANLPYLKNITIETLPVAGEPDEVDLNYHMEEIAAGRISAQAGYSDTDGILYGGDITEPNFLGTGHYVSVGFTRSGFQNNYFLTYSNPFYTLDGVSRTIQLYYNQTTAKAHLHLDTYTMDDIGGSVTYGIPMSDFDLFSLGYGYDYINLYNINHVVSPFFNQGAPPPAAPSILQFTQIYHSPFHQFNGTIGWTHATLDRAVFPTEGTSQSIVFTAGAPIIRRSVGYYKVVYDGKWFWPLGHGFVIDPHADLGYGGGFGKTHLFPFYNNFYAGGIDTLPGFQPNSLGPRNPNNGQYIGGNLEILGGVNFIFPNPISERIRTAVFLDAGNVFSTNRTKYTAADFAINPFLQQMTYESISISNLRVSTGLMVSWYSPLGPLEFSLGTPLVKKRYDITAIFGFSMGASI